jgi:hypothetical protein
MAYYFKRLNLNQKSSCADSKSRFLYSRSYKMAMVPGGAEGQKKANYSKIIVLEDLVANCGIILEQQESLARKIIRYSLTRGSNLIMIGCKGTNQLVSFLIGCIAMKLAEISYRLPVLIDKQRRVKSDTLEAFLCL